MVAPSKTIWIDLDNSPHVPLFRPIIRELEHRGFRVHVTARDVYQTRELADLLLDHPYHLIGRHFGRHRVLKVLGTLCRSLQLAAAVRRARPVLALGHGSRSQALAARILRVPSITMVDYEHAADLPIFRPNWFLAPDVIPAAAFPGDGSHLRRYPGIKENVYVQFLDPDAAIRDALGIAPDDILVAFRPPATEAHYHNPESEVLSDAALRFLLKHPETRVVVLPRHDRQRREFQRRWGEAIAARRFILPPRALDGLNLLWHCDAVISGGGTMNREAAALGVPVYSIFRGRIGAVDRHLAEAGRLTILESAADVEAIVRLERRPAASRSLPPRSETLDRVVQQIVSILREACREEEDPTADSAAPPGPGSGAAR